MIRYLSVVWVIAAKDLRIELRVRERVVAMAGFAGLAVILLDFALDRSGVDVPSMVSGLLWMTIVFAGVLGLDRGFHLEEEDAAFQGLLTAPIPVDAVFFGKVLANFVLLGAVAFFTVIMFVVFFDADLLSRPGILLITLGFGLLGFTALGTFFSAISLRSTMGSTLLPILLFPLLVPMVVFGVNATNRILQGRPLGEFQGMIRLLVAFAVVALVGCGSLFRAVTEE